MGHYIIELAIWVLLAYFIGCFIGWLLRYLFGAKEVPLPMRSEPMKTVSVPAAPPPPVPEIVPIPKMPEPVVARMERPKGLSEARAGKADNLQRINGIGPKNERILHNLGFFHFDQLAEWTTEQISWVDNHLKFNGRIGREQWVRQARMLANGEEDEFMRLFGANQPRE